MSTAPSKKKPNPVDTPPGLLTVRSALILLLGVVLGIGAIKLQIWGGSSTPNAIAYGVGAAAAAIVFFNKAIAKM